MKRNHFQREQETICWKCRNCTRCSWADGIPVKGWEATPTVVRDSDGDYNSYFVHKCPQFEPDTKEEVAVREIAAILGCSKTTIFKTLKANGGKAWLCAKLKGKGYKLYIGVVPTKSGEIREYILEKIN